MVTHQIAKQKFVGTLQLERFLNHQRLESVNRKQARERPAAPKMNRAVLHWHCSTRWHGERLVGYLLVTGCTLFPFGAFKKKFDNVKPL